MRGCVRGEEEGWGSAKDTEILRSCLISKGGGTLTLRQTEPGVKTTGRKSHDPLKLTESRGSRTNTEGDTQGRGGGGQR